jgi:hypothetical protein
VAGSLNAGRTLRDGLNASACMPGLLLAWQQASYGSLR